MKKLLLILLLTLIITGCSTTKSETVYVNEELGFSIDLMSEYRDFNTEMQAIGFGPLTAIPEAPTTVEDPWAQCCSLQIKEPRHENDAMWELMDKPGLLELNTITLDNGLSAVKYIDTGLCEYPNLEIATEKFNIVLEGSICGLKDAEAFYKEHNSVLDYFIEVANTLMTEQYLPDLSAASTQ